MYCGHRDFILSLERNIKNGNVTDLVLRIKDEIEKIKKETEIQPEGSDYLGNEKAVFLESPAPNCS